MTSSSLQSSTDLHKGSDILDEIVGVCCAAADGDLEPRVLASTDDKRLAQIANAINSLLDSVDVYVRESTAMLAAASERRYYRKVLVRGMKGTFKNGARLLNEAGHEMEAQHDQIGCADKERSDMVRELEETLQESSQRIINAIKSISRITKGTHMLALNAKIEASRAGQAGLGFAIVAHEVELTSARIEQVMSEIDHAFEQFGMETSAVLHKVVTKSAA